MIRYAITGNIASGKSQVENILKKNGFLVFDTDLIAHKILETSEEVKKEFFEYDICKNGKISRSKLGKIVFDNEELRRKLENIIHPKVRSEIINIFEQHKDKKAVFISIPLLFESKMENLFDKIIFIYADDNIRLERLMKRNNFTKEEALSRINAQINQSEKLERSHFVIKNESTLHNLENQVQTLLSL